MSIDFFALYDRLSLQFMDLPQIVVFESNLDNLVVTSTGWNGTIWAHDSSAKIFTVTSTFLFAIHCAGDYGLEGIQQLQKLYGLGNQSPHLRLSDPPFSVPERPLWYTMDRLRRRSQSLEFSWL